jgi:hypothetical protein
MTEKDERNYGTVEQLAPSYDAAAAAAQEMYALHGSNAQKQLEGIGPQREMAEAGAVQNVQTGTANEVTSTELGAATETLEQIMDLVSAELAIMEVSRKNSLDRQQQALDGYLQAMEAGLPYLEKTIQSRLDSIDAARGGGGGGGGTSTGGGTTDSGYALLSDEDKAVINEVVGEPEYGDDPLNPANPMDTGLHGGEVTNAGLLAEIWGIVPQQMDMFVGPDGNLPQHLQHLQEIMNTYIANGYSPQQAAVVAYEGVMAEGGENFTEDQTNSLDRFTTVLIGVNSHQNDLEGYEDKWTWQEREAAGITPVQGNWYSADQYTYNQGDALQGQGFDVAGLPEGVGSGIVRRSPKEHYDQVPSGVGDLQEGNTKPVFKDQESRRYIKDLIRSEVTSWGDKQLTASEFKAKGYDDKEVEILLKIQEAKAAGKDPNNLDAFKEAKKIEALEEQLVDHKAGKEGAAKTYNQMLGIDWPTPEQQQAREEEADDGYTPFYAVTPDQKEDALSRIPQENKDATGGNLFDLLTGNTETTNFARGDEYLQALLDQRAADFARAQETDKQFEAIHTAPTTQGPKNIDLMYKQMMDRLAREEEERRKQAAAQAKLDAVIASQTAEQHMVLPTSPQRPKQVTASPTYDYSQANESWILF